MRHTISPTFTFSHTKWHIWLSKMTTETPLSITHNHNDEDVLECIETVYDFEERVMWGFCFPFTVDWLFSVVGSEYVHTYFWICKDLAWTQDWRMVSLAFGIAAVAWCGVLMYHAIRLKNSHEVINQLGIFLWIFANFWWLSGEVYDENFLDDLMPGIEDQRDNQCASILELAICILVFYYLVIMPFNLLPLSETSVREYDDGTMSKRFSYFQNFRQYENVHMFFWLAKDLAWVRDNINMWFVFLAPTVCLSADYLYLSWKTENAIVDTAHYAAALLWVLGNTVWALGEFFWSDYDNPETLWKGSKEAYRTARWYSSWLLFSAFWPVFIMYCFWIPLTCAGKLTPKKKRIRKVRVLKKGGYGATTEPHEKMSADEERGEGARGQESDRGGDGDGSERDTGPDSSSDHDPLLGDDDSTSSLRVGDVMAKAGAEKDRDRGQVGGHGGMTVRAAKGKEGDVMTMNALAQAAALVVKERRRGLAQPHVPSSAPGTPVSASPVSPTGRGGRGSRGAQGGGRGNVCSDVRDDVDDNDVDETAKLLL